MNNDDEVGEAFYILKQAIQDDDAYAHAWHCNLAMCFYDALPGPFCDDDHESFHKVSNNAASRFMSICFDVDTNNDMLDKENKK